MSQDQKKRNAAKVAIDYIKNNAIIGVGTGSTINFFIEEKIASPFSVLSGCGMIAITFPF